MLGVDAFGFVEQKGHFAVHGVALCMNDLNNLRPFRLALALQIDSDLLKFIMDTLKHEANPFEFHFESIGCSII